MMERSSHGEDDRVRRSSRSPVHASRARKDSKRHSKKAKSSARKKRKRRYESSTSDNTYSSSSCSSPAHKHPKKKKHKHKRKKRAEVTSAAVKFDAKESTVKQMTKSPSPSKQMQRDAITTLKATLAAQKTSKVRGAMTREEYEQQQSVVRRVYDPDTGRHRLVKGDGEIIEEIVSRDRQKAINKQATMGDGLSFQMQMKKLL